MRSALYYPHTTIANESILKRALLLWDTIEYISPWQGYGPNYIDPLFAEAAEIVAKAHVPSREEQMQAHQQIEDLATSSLPDAFYFHSREEHGDYEIYPKKFLPETWRLLQQVRIAGDPRANSDLPLSKPGED